MNLQIQSSHEIIDILKRSSRPLGFRQITSRLRRSTPITEYAVLRELRHLLRQGDVEFYNGAWAVAGETPVEAACPHSFRLPVLSRETHQELWPDIPWGAPGAEEGFSPHRVGGRWGVFRRLMAYYIQCVRNEEGADASAFLDQLNQTFIYIRRIGFWQPRPGVRWQMTQPIGSHMSEFLKALPASSDDSHIVLGYPLAGHCKQGEDGLFTSIVRPVFYYPIQVEMVGQGLRLTIETPIPEVNLGWLEYSFSRNAERQRNFLSACGFIRTQVYDDAPPGREVGEVAPSLEILTTALSSFLPEKIREQLHLGDVPGDPLKEPFESGIYNRAVVMLARRTRYSKGLLRELAAIAKAPDEDLEKTALSHIFTEMKGPSECESVSSLGEGMAAEVFPFNASQRRAVDSLLSRGLSVVTGPPGTGKSQVVAGTAANARFQGHSVLISSRNHKAIDAVVEKLVGPDGESLVVRANSKEIPDLRMTFSIAIKAMLAAQADPEPRYKRALVLEDLNSRLEERRREAAAAKQMSELAEALGAIEDRLAYLFRELPSEAPPVLDTRPQIFPVQALELTAQGLGRGNSPWGVMALLLPYLRLRRGLRHIPGMPVLPLLPSRKARQILLENMKLLEQTAEYAALRMTAQEKEQQAAGFQPLDEITNTVSRISERIRQLVPELLSLDLRSRRGLRDGVDRPMLAGLRSALNSVQTGLADGRLDHTAINSLRSNGQEILHAFPVWALTSLSISSRIPFCPGLFDLTLIDEASQSDIPSAIPVLFRAQRVGVIGDPLQLTHTSKLSPAKDTLLRRDLELSRLEDQRFAYTQSSLYDLCAGTKTAQPVFLDTTYRSAQDIADYSSYLFYDGRLRVGTDSEGLATPKGMTAGIHWTDIQGEVKSGGGSGCHCEEEIQEVARLARNLLEDRQFPGTLGIVTPFRQQANRILDAITQGGVRYDAFTKARLHVDTAHGFQGDERDVILFSLCGGPGMPGGSRHFLQETANLFNVAVSRARAVLHVVGNRQWAVKCGIRHVELLARPQQFRKTYQPTGPWHPHESPYEKMLFDALKEVGLDPIPQFPVRYRRLDMALVRQGAPGLKLDIEVDGDCHRNADGSRKQDDLWRDIELKGMGWEVVRFWTYQLRENLSGCAAKIKTIWEQA
jgi:very-short-patch-repair endonuclease